MSELRRQAAESYRDRWSVDPDAVLFSPGRINLIGDHTDYSLLPVLPMAIQFGIALAVGDGDGDGDGDGTVTIDSLNEPCELIITAEGESRSESAPASWHRYAEIAIRSISVPPSGVRVLLSGDLPSTGGLSSSSALVVGILAAVTSRGGTPLHGQDLADTAVAAERMAAIEGGAMDQTIIVFGQQGAAVRLEFDPPARRVIPVPDGLSFVAAYSGDQAAKGASAKDDYNIRVVACRAGAALLSTAMGRDAAPDPLVLGRLGSVPAELLAALPETATAREVAETSGVPVSLLVAMAAGDFDPDRPIPIRACAKHVVTEAAAVDAMERAMAAADLDEVGSLLNSSHQSLRSFGSSTPSLDKLTSAVVSAGALGARVTGAGFGGYAIAACRTEDLATVIDAAVAATGGPAFEVTPSQGIG